MTSYRLDAQIRLVILPRSYMFGLCGIASIYTKEGKDKGMYSLVKFTSISGKIDVGEAMEWR